LRVRKPFDQGHSSPPARLPMFLQVRALIQGQRKVRGGLAATSLADDERLLRLHLRPYFGGRQMDSIRHSVVQAWVTERLSAGVQPARIREAHTLLHTILNAAIKDGVLSGENACRFTDLPMYQRREMRILTPEEYDAILSEMPGAFRLIVRALLEETGCRWSELVGLRVCDAQFLHRRVLIRQAIVENSGNPNRWVVKDTKGKRERAISVSPEWLDEVAQHIGREGLGEQVLLFALTVPAHPLGAAKPVEGTTARARAGARENGIRVGTHGRLRPEVLAAYAARSDPEEPKEASQEEVRRPIGRGQFRRVWVQACAAAGVKGVRVHDLRHSHASWLCASGLPTVEVQERMGHTDLKTTEGYLHTLPDRKDEVVTALRKIRDRSRAV
jgi:integrase